MSFEETTMDKTIIKNPTEKGASENKNESLNPEADKLVQEAEAVLAGATKEDKVAEHAKVLQDIESLKNNGENNAEKIKQEGRERLKNYVNQALDVLIDDVTQKFNKQGEPGRFAKWAGIKTKEEMANNITTLTNQKGGGDSAVVGFDNILALATFSGRDAKNEVKAIEAQYKSEDLDSLLTDQEKKVMNLASRHIGVGNSPANPG